MSLNKPNNEIDTSALAQESTSQEIKLSNESIKAVADEILAKIGLTNDVEGGANTGTVFGKLNALFSSGGGSNMGNIKRIQNGYVKDIICTARDPVFENTYYVFVDLDYPVDESKSFLRLENVQNPLLTNDRTAPLGRIYQTNQLVLYYNYRDGSPYIKDLYWEVVEFN